MGIELETKQRLESEQGSRWHSLREILHNPFAQGIGRETEKLIRDHALPIARELLVLPIRTVIIAGYGGGTMLKPPSWKLLKDPESLKHYLGVLWAANRGKPGSISIADEGKDIFGRIPTTVKGTKYIKDIPVKETRIVGTFHQNGDPTGELTDSFIGKVMKMIDPESPLRGFCVAPKIAEELRKANPEKETTVVFEVRKYPLDNMGEKLDELTNGQYVPWEAAYYSLPPEFKNVWEHVWNVGKWPFSKLSEDLMQHMAVSMNFIQKEKGIGNLLRSLRGGKFVIVFMEGKAVLKQERASDMAGGLCLLAANTKDLNAKTTPAVCYPTQQGLHVEFGPAINCSCTIKRPGKDRYYAQVVGNNVSREIGRLLPPKFRDYYAEEIENSERIVFP